MILAYAHRAGRLVPLDPGAPLQGAVWIDLLRPTADEAAGVNALGVDVPSLADMEEIEISNRLYREAGVDYMTVVLQGHSETRSPISGPVTFILQPGRLVTVRHHDSRPFETFPARADKGSAGCDTAGGLFLSLVEEIIGRLADLLESVGKTLDVVQRGIHDPGRPAERQTRLQGALREVSREGELLGIVRLALLTLDRALGFHRRGRAARGETGGRTGTADPGGAIAALARDITALEVHVDFLSNRVALASDATMGLINLEQNATVRIVSVVAVLFLPPTLIASIYGMNFDVMPELGHAWGYPAALGAMLVSAVGSWAFFRWKNWL